MNKIKDKERWMGKYLFSALILLFCEEGRLESTLGKLRGIFDSRDRVRVIGGPYNIAIWTDWTERKELLRLIVESVELTNFSVQPLTVYLSIERTDVQKSNCN